MSHFDDDFQNQPGFFRRNRTAIGIGAVVLIGAIGAVVKFGGHGSAPRREAPVTIVSLALPTPLPTPPPPPPPPPQAPPPEQKMMEQAPVTEEEQKPEPPAPKDEPISTNIPSDGRNDGFGLGRGGNGTIGGHGNGGRDGGSKWGWYAGAVQNRIAEGLRNNRKTRSAGLSVQVRIWPDASGRITRAQLAGTTGDRALDDAIQNEVLTGLQLSEPPPQGMPMPIVMRLTARRPN